MPKFPNIQVRGSTVVNPNKIFYSLKKHRSSKGLLGVSFFLGALLICFILAAISIDFARQVSVQTELQAATDAAAIAAEYAITHPAAPSTAQSIATIASQQICTHTIANGAPIPSHNVTTVVDYSTGGSGSSSIPTVTVTAYVNCINLFASQFGRPSDKISATSVAGEVNPGTASSVFPLAIPPNTWTPGKLYTVYLLTNPGNHGGAAASLSPGSTPYTNGPNSTTPLPGLPVTPTTNDHNPFNTLRFIAPPGENQSPLPGMIPYVSTNSPGVTTNSPSATPSYSINPLSPQALPNITSGTQYSIPSSASLPSLSVGQTVNLTTGVGSDGSLGLNTTAQFMQGSAGNGYTYSSGNSPNTGTATLTSSPPTVSSNQVIGNSSTLGSVNPGSVAPFLAGQTIPVAIVSPGGSDGGGKAGGGHGNPNSTNSTLMPTNGYGNDNNSHGTVQGFAQIQIQGVTNSWYGWGASYHADNAFANQLVGITFKMISVNGSMPVGGIPNPNMYTPVLIQ